VKFGPDSEVPTGTTESSPAHGFNRGLRVDAIGYNRAPRIQRPAGLATTWLLLCHARPQGVHDTPTGARAVPARSTSLGRGGLEHSWAFPPAMLLRTGTVRGPAVAVSKCARPQPVHLEVVGLWERGLPPSRRARAPLRRDGGQAASACMSRRGWNSPPVVRRATAKRRKRRAPMPTSCGRPSAGDIEEYSFLPSPTA